MPGHKRDHYTGDYDRRAKAVTTKAKRNPATRCMSPECKHGNGTLAQHPPGSTWDAGHINAGQPNGPLQPEVSCCNRAAGARIGNRRRKGLANTRNW